MSGQAILDGDEDLQFLIEAFEIAFDSSSHWLRSLDVTDWRSRRYRGRPPRKFEQPADPKAGRPPVKLFASKNEIRSAVQQGVPADSKDFNIVVCPERSAEKQRWICIVRVVPTVNKDGQRHVNFHVWFHGVDNANPNIDLFMGWRLEGSEGKQTNHDLYHAQPLRGLDRGEITEGFIRWIPDGFPTIPIAAKNQLQLAFVALITVGGKEALRKVLQDATTEKLRDSAREFWGSIYAGDILKA